MKLYRSLGLASLVIGFFSLVSIFLFYPTLVGAPIGLVAGLVSFPKVKDKKQATIGIILNALALLLLGLLVWFLSGFKGGIGP